MRLGTDTVTFRKPGVVADRLHKVNAQSPSEVDVENCSFQPLSVKDDVSNTDLATATHRCIAPATDLTWACKAGDQLEFNSQTYHVMGNRRHPRRHHVTVYAREEH